MINAVGAIERRLNFENRPVAFREPCPTYGGQGPGIALRGAGYQCTRLPV